jgi:hypothetical protein
MSSISFPSQRADLRMLECGGGPAPKPTKQDENFLETAIKTAGVVLAVLLAVKVGIILLPIVIIGALILAAMCCCGSSNNQVSHASGGAYFPPVPFPHGLGAHPGGGAGGGQVHDGRNLLFGGRQPPAPAAVRPVAPPAQGGVRNLLFGGRQQPIPVARPVGGQAHDGRNLLFGGRQSGPPGGPPAGR